MSQEMVDHLNHRHVSRVFTQVEGLQVVLSPQAIPPGPWENSETHATAVRGTSAALLQQGLNSECGVESHQQQQDLNSECDIESYENEPDSDSETHGPASCWHPPTSGPATLQDGTCNGGGLTRAKMGNSGAKWESAIGKIVNAGKLFAMLDEGYSSVPCSYANSDPQMNQESIQTQVSNGSVRFSSAASQMNQRSAQTKVSSMMASVLAARKWMIDGAMAEGHKKLKARGNAVQTVQVTQSHTRCPEEYPRNCVCAALRSSAACCVLCVLLLMHALECRPPNGSLHYRKCWCKPAV
jgi:hypothetical protein